MKTFIVEVTGQEGNECSYAVIGVDLSLAEKILAIRKKLCEMKETIDSVYAVEVFDYTPDFIKDDSSDELLSQFPSENGPSEESYFCVQGEVNTDDLKLERVQVETLIITEDSFYWKATPKHTSLSIGTFQIPINELEELLLLENPPKLIFKG